MSIPCDREGSFRAEITEYGLKEADSGAVAVTIRVHLLEMYSDGQWEDWRQYDVEAFGDVWIVKKDNGGLNAKAVESLMRHTGWNGDIDSIVHGTWQPTPCQVAIKADTYENVTRYRVSFINDYDRVPGAVGNVTEDKAKQLASKFGPELRALYGNVARNGAAPAGGSKPQPPKKSVQSIQQEAQAATAAIRAGDGEDSPF